MHIKEIKQNYDAKPKKTQPIDNECEKRKEGGANYRDTAKILSGRRSF